VYIKDEGLNKKTRTEVDHAVKRAEALFKDIMAKVEGAFTK